MSNVDLQDQTEYSRHIPVLLNTFLENLEPISGFGLMAHLVTVVIAGHYWTPKFPI